ncbi:GNAT family N-acetyltransferase [Comamonas faecalis]|uniref:GNAT family N-acetyltransferase n=1 Tax=Comamonas faecalis TaxID=1387849 RepID=A0ABP7QXU3_9BURK
MSTTHYLSALFDPRSIAVIGASENPGSTGYVIFNNLLSHAYQGRLVAVNPHHDTLLGQPCVPDIESVPVPVDLAIITTPPRTIAQVIAQCARVGIHHVIVVSHPAGVASNAAAIERRIREAALSADVRFMGPKSLGFVRPHVALNATFTDISAIPGDLALVAQSGAMCAAVLDWATMSRVGISLAVSLGEAMNIDFGDVLDYLANDEHTRYILLHVEKIRHARRFISALRSAARIKPVIVLKSGNHASDDDLDGDAAALADQVFDAAVRRAGAVRVSNVSQLFHAARALAGGLHPRGSRLAIISNGTGPARMAADSARRLGVPLATLQADTQAALKPLLPADWHNANPIDLSGDATTERYLEVTQLLVRDAAVDAVLIVLSPMALVSPQVVAEGLVRIARESAVALCCCFMGGQLVGSARKTLEDAGVPVFRTPDTVIELFHNISNYYDNQKLLLEVPSPGRGTQRAASGNGRALVDALIAERCSQLSRMQAHALLHSYGVVVRPSLGAHSITEALFVAEQLGLPVDMYLETVRAPASTAEQAVRRKLSSLESVRSALHDLAALQDAEADGGAPLHVSLAPSRERSHALHFVLRVLRDPVFGPVLLLGAAGLQGEVLRDMAVALPPLNRVLARNLIEATRLGQTLQAGATRPAADQAALEDALIAVSNMVCDLPALETLEIHPLIVDAQGCQAVEARVVIDPIRGEDQGRFAHLAIHPYPAQLCQEWRMRDGSRIQVRPVRPEDAVLEQAFVSAMSDESRHFRFMDGTRELPPSQIVRLTQIDYDREMALIAVVRDDDGERQVGSVRYVQTPDGESVEFALAVADAWQKCGLGRRLMEVIIDCARDKLYRSIVGEVLANNAKMLKLMTRLGFAVLPHPERTDLKWVVKPLRE